MLEHWLIVAWPTKFPQMFDKQVPKYWQLPPAKYVHSHDVHARKSGSFSPFMQLVSPIDCILQLHLHPRLLLLPMIPPHLAILQGTPLPFSLMSSIPSLSPHLWMKCQDAPLPFLNHELCILSCMSRCALLCMVICVLVHHCGVVLCWGVSLYAPLCIVVLLSSILCHLP